MNKQTDKNGSTNGKETRLNNSQRKALAESIKARYQVLIDQATKRNQYAQETAVEHARKKLGYYLLKKRIASLELEAEDLTRKLNQLGFDSNGSLRTEWDTKANQFVPVSCEVKRLIEGESLDSAKDLEHERDEKITKIWLAETAKEAREVVCS